MGKCRAAVGERPVIRHSATKSKERTSEVFAKAQRIDWTSAEIEEKRK